MASERAGLPLGKLITDDVHRLTDEEQRDLAYSRADMCPRCFEIHKGACYGK